MTPTKPPVHNPDYLTYLDAVRGIAATWVMLYHYINMRFYEHSMGKIASVFLNGETTIFLFVLSGFVLSYKHIVLKHPLDMRKYFIYRFLRLWPAFFVAVLINYLYFFRHELQLQQMAGHFLLNKGQFWQEALMIRYNPTHGSNPQYYLPGWAIVMQLSISFFMPFMIALANRNVQFVWWMLVAFVLIGNSVGVMYGYHIHYALGLLVSCYFVFIEKGGLSQYKWYKYRYVILIAAFILFSARQLDRFNRISIFNEDYKYWVHEYLGLGFSHYSAIASFIFLIWVIQSRRLKTMLNSSFFRFLGKVSYCLYLMHWVVIKAIFDKWDIITPYFSNEFTAVVAMLPVCILSSFLLATILHYLVELPTIRLGKRVTEKLKPSFVIQPE